MPQEKYKHLKEKDLEKQEALEEPEKGCQKMEIQQKECFSEMTNLIVQNKQLQN